MPLLTAEKFRLLGRYTISQPASITNIPANGFLTLIGPALQLPTIQAPQALRIVNAYAKYFEPTNATAIFLNYGRIELTGAKNGGSIQVPYRSYICPVVTNSAALTSTGVAWSATDTEEIRSNDYIELTGQGAAQPSASNFAIQLVSSFQNTTAAIVAVTQNLTVLFELLSREAAL